MAVARPPTRVYMPPKLGKLNNVQKWHIIAQESPREYKGEIVNQTVCNMMIDAGIVLATKDLRDCHVDELCRTCFRAFELSEV